MTATEPLRLNTVKPQSPPPEERTKMNFERAAEGKEKIIQICVGSNNNPMILTSFGRILAIVSYPLRDVDGNVCSYGSKWQDITPKIEEIKIGE